MQSTTAISMQSGKAIPVMTGHVGSRIKGKKQHERSHTRRHSRCDSGTLVKSKDDTNPLYLALRSERNKWEKRKDSKGHVVTGEYVIRQLKEETAKLLIDNGIDPSAPISNKCLVEPLVSKHVTQQRSYKEPGTGLKPVRPLKPSVTVGAKSARPSMGRIDPIEAQYVRPDGTVPLATPEEKQDAHLSSAKQKEDVKFKIALMRHHAGCLPDDRVTNAVLKGLAPFYVKASHGWSLKSSAKDACPYVHAHYQSAWNKVYQLLAI